MQELLMVAAFLLPIAAFGLSEGTPDEALFLGKPVGRISIIGLTKTKSDVVYRELQISEGRILTQLELNESVQRLKNTRLFSHVQVQVSLDENNQAHVVFDINEKWTVIPVFQFSQGGNTRYFVTGIYDYNTLGRFTETGFQYEMWNSEPGGVVWFRKPRFLGKRVLLGGDAWYTNRPVELYTQQGESQGRFVRNRSRFNFFLHYEYNPNITAGAGVDINSDRLLAIETTELLNQQTRLQLQDSQKKLSAFARFYLKFGRVNYDSYLLQGADSEITIEQASTLWWSEISAFRMEWDSRYFIRFGHELNLGMRLRFATTNSPQLVHMYYIGGFEHIRGYLDGQLRGRQYAQTNVELRLPVFKLLPWAVLQTNLFLDFAKILKSNQLENSSEGDQIYSAGIGLRFISPKIYRFIGRLDFALITSRRATSRFSFGAQQFF